LKGDVEGTFARTILEVVGWAIVGIGIFFALWVSYVISTAFVWCGIILCHWTWEMLFRVLIITALPIATGLLILRYDEKRREKTRKSAD
jgi:sugar phosphate permease